MPCHPVNTSSKSERRTSSTASSPIPKCPSHPLKNHPYGGTHLPPNNSRNPRHSRLTPPNTSLGRSSTRPHATFLNTGTSSNWKNKEDLDHQLCQRVRPPFPGHQKHQRYQHVLLHPKSTGPTTQTRHIWPHLLQHTPTKRGGLPHQNDRGGISHRLPWQQKHTHSQPPHSQTPVQFNNQHSRHNLPWNRPCQFLSPNTCVSNSTSSLTK